MVLLFLWKVVMVFDQYQNFHPSLVGNWITILSTKNHWYIYIYIYILWVRFFETHGNLTNKDPRTSLTRLWPIVIQDYWHCSNQQHKLCDPVSVINMLACSILEIATNTVNLTLVIFVKTARVCVTVVLPLTLYHDVRLLLIYSDLEWWRGQQVPVRLLASASSRARRHASQFLPTFVDTRC